MFLYIAILYFLEHVCKTVFLAEVYSNVWSVCTSNRQQINFSSDVTRECIFLDWNIYRGKIYLKCL